MLKSEIHYISKSQSERLIDNLSNQKHKTIIMLMLDAGLRVTEACSIKFKHFDFKKRIINVESLKKRSAAKIIRKVPISNRLYNQIADYIEKSKLKLEPNNFLFPSKSQAGHIGRKTIWRLLKVHGKNLGIENLHPHTLRHTFATHHLSNGTKLVEIKEMLGHRDYNTTLIYASIPLETLRDKVNQVTETKKSIFQVIVKKLFPEPTNKIINLNFSNQQFSIGRNKEIQKISGLVNKNINTILVGNIGTGKSHLLENLETDKKILRLDDADSIKKSLVNILLYLYKGDKKSVYDLVWSGFQIEEIKKRIQRETTAQICTTISKVVEKNEYVLLIDDITRITPTGKKALEKLKDTFVIVTSARFVKANDTSFLWNFEKIEIDNLKRSESIKLIQSKSSGIEVENWEIFRNHIFEQTNGNPRAIDELIERYRKEPFLTNEIVREIKHTGALKEFDFTFIVVIFLGIVMTLRYMARDFDEPALRMIGSIGMILLIFMRPMMMQFKKKFI